MSTQIFINTNIPDINTFNNAIHDNVTQINVDIDGRLNDYYNLNFNRIGFVWENNTMDIPFGTTELIINEYTFIYFKKELFDYLNRYNNITIDLISCFLNDPLFLSEVELVKSNLNNINIEYSLNATGSVEGSDWIMESNDSSILEIYFTNDILDYKHILGGGEHSAFVANDSSVYIWGRNYYGTLGNGTSGNGADNPNPLQLSDASSNVIFNIIAVSSGGTSTAILKNDGTVWTMGSNTYGQLGIGTNVESLWPTQVLISNFIVQISCAGNFMTMLDISGNVWACGRGQEGQLGNGLSNPSNIPVKVNISNVLQISCGAGFTTVIKDDGTVWTFGSNGSNQLGDGTTANRNTPVQITIPNYPINVSCGANHSMVLYDDGTIWAFGYNLRGQLGYGDNAVHSEPVQVSGTLGGSFTTDAVAVSCGAYHSVVRKTDGTIWVCGWNVFSQCGTGNTTDLNKLVQNIDTSDTKRSSVAGGYHTLTLDDSGLSWGYGANTFGSLGTGTIGGNVATPVQTIISSGIINTFMDVVENVIHVIPTEEITTEEITTEEITTQEPTTEEITTEEITTQEITTQEPTTEEIIITTQEPTTEEIIITTQPVIITTEEMTTQPVIITTPPIIATPEKKIITSTLVNSANWLEFGV
jgi:alpha-tubulin suppressor-like RCC1 family protein